MVAKNAEQKLAESFEKFACDIRFSPKYFGGVLADSHSIVSVKMLDCFIGYIDSLSYFYEKGLCNDNDRAAGRFATDLKYMITDEYGWYPEWT